MPATILEARCGFSLFVDFDASLGAVLGASTTIPDVVFPITASAARGLTASVLDDVIFEVLGNGYATPALNDPAGPVIIDFGLALSPMGSLVFPLEFDYGSPQEGSEAGSSGGDNGGGGDPSPGASDGFELLLGSVETEGSGAWQSGAVTLTDVMPVSIAVDDLNAILGLLVPAAPPAFPNGTLTIVDQAGSSPHLATGVTDNSGTSVLGASSAVTRTTDAAVTSNTFAGVGPGKSGLITVLLNGADAGHRTLTGTGDAGTYGGLLIANQHDFPTATPGFWKSVDVSVSALSVPIGINKIKLTDTAAGSTSEFFFVRDALTATPVISGSSIVEATAGTKAFSSSVPHYNTGGQIQITSLAYTNLSGECYYGGTDPLTIQGANGVFPAQTFTYAGIGINIPMARQTTSPSAVSTLLVNVNPTNVHGSGVAQGFAKNANGAGTLASLTAQLILVKNGSAGSKIDENAVTVTGLGSSPNASNAARVANGSGDTPATAASAWTSSATIQTYDATVVGGVLSHDATDYATGYLPVGPDLSSGRSAAQYVTFAFDRASLSQFKIEVTGAYAGCWIKLPGVSDQSGISPNAPNGWWDATKAYVGAGVPGGGADTLAGCASGTVMSGGSGTFTITFGTQSSSNATGNQILIRLKLNTGQSITSLSFSN